MEPATPVVSIGMPVYNGAQYLEAALDSILAQTFEDFELVISDNASTDRTQEICEAYAARDPRIRYYRTEKNFGAARNFNRTFELARGRYFKWAAHDDLLEPEFLQRCVATLECNSLLGLCYTATRVIDEAGDFVENYEDTFRTDSPRPQERLYDLLWKSNRAYEVFGVIRSDILRETPLIGAYAASDRVLLGALSLNGRFACLPEPLFISRKHAKSSVRAYPSRHKRAAWFDTSKRGRPTFPAWEMLFGFLQVLQRAPLKARDRLACYRVIARWTWHRRKLLLDDLIVAIKQIVLMTTVPVAHDIQETQELTLRSALVSMGGAYLLKLRMWRVVIPLTALLVLVTGLISSRNKKKIG